jgi:predicted nucleic acid-binding protein
MTFNKIFVDSDILLDFLLNRPGFADYSQALVNRGNQKSLSLFTSALILANVHYIITKNVNKETAKRSVQYLVDIMNILPFEVSHINFSINQEYIDLEDGIQYYIAKQNNCDIIITRNIKHYKKFDIPVLTAENFYESYYHNATPNRSIHYRNKRLFAG